MTLKFLFAAILLVMLGVTGWASLQGNVWDGGRAVIHEPWGLATLADAYCGFLTFYAWVFYRERGVLARLLWLVAILAFGNIAMSIYVLIALYSLPKDAPFERLWLRKT